MNMFVTSLLKTTIMIPREHCFWVSSISVSNFNVSN